MTAMAGQTLASPREAAIAQAWLDAHPRRTLSRDDIFAAPDLRAAVGSAWVWDPRLRVRVLMDLDDPAFVGLHVVYDDDEFWDGED